MSHDKLARTANQIATFFATRPHAEAVAGVAGHINEFWEPRMRRQFLELVAAGGDGLHPLVPEAARLVKPPRDTVAQRISPEH